MEEFQGASGNWHKGVFFTEGAVQKASTRHGKIVVEISRQNSNLIEVKNEMAQQAIAKGANVIQNFQYGQKAHDWRDLIFSFKWDTESWHGSGDAVTVQ